MNRTTLHYNPADCGRRELELLNSLAEFYPLSADCGEVELQVRISGDGAASCRVEQTGDGGFRVTASDTALAARAVGSILAGGGAFTEKRDFKTFAVLLDCTRNLVFNPTYLRRYFAALALTGCNMAMLYTKDAYRLPDEPYFGYLRGAYTMDELRSIDDCAAKFGIELVGAIQALGHLEPVLRWPAYAAVCDTASVLLTTEPASGDLIGKMLDFYSGALRSRRIHLGMDETHDLGRGRYLDINGYRRGFDIYNDHLAKVMTMCRDRGFAPMIWSDMYFRMGSRSLDYYDLEAVIPPDVAAAIPPGVTLAYWDYYHTDEGFYSEWLRRHFALAGRPVMTSGIWTWGTFWYDHASTAATAVPCVAACRKAGVEEIVFAMWGDDGSYCDWGSALAGVEYVSSLLHSGGAPAPAARFRAICGGDYELHLKLGRLGERLCGLKLLAPAVLWDDPLLEIYWKEQFAAHGADYWPTVEKLYDELFEAASAVPYDPSGIAGDTRHAALLIDVLRSKIRLIGEMRRAAADEEFRKKLLESDRFDRLLRRFDELDESFRAHWLRFGNPNGMELMQIRLAGQKSRWREAERRLRELKSGEHIEEIEEAASSCGSVNQYKYFATASFFI